MTGLLTKDLILNADDRPVVDVAVPEWGGTVRLQSMTGEQRDLFDQAFADSTDSRDGKVRNFRALLVACSAVDADGKLVFAIDDVQLLARKSGAALDRVFDAAMRLNKMSKQDQREIVGN